MIGLIQRVSSASVEVNGEIVAKIERGLLVFVGVQRDDNEQRTRKLGERLLGYRVFPGDNGKMNRSVVDIDGAVLLVPQFTLAADTSSGTLASFTSAAPPELAKPLFSDLVHTMQTKISKTQQGVFGADMRISLVNEGPVTFWLST